MDIFASSPYAPDAASDWWNFAVNVLIGLATLAALGTSIWQARRASAEASRAEVVAKIALDREQAREAAQRHEALVSRAARQATAVRVSPSSSFNGQTFSVDVAVSNDSDLPIRDVKVIGRGTRGRELHWRVGRVQAAGRGHSFLPIEISAEELDEAISSLTIEFTDAYLDSWRIGPDERIALIGSAEVTTERP